MVDQKIIEEFVEQIKPDNKESNKTHSAIVSKIDEEGTVWVRVAGSDKDTPTALVGAEVKKGDAVNVEWRNNKLYIASNYSNPAAGVGRVGAVEQAAQLANEAANNAVLDAGRAKEAADSASASAEQAQKDAGSAKESAENAGEYAARALGNLSTVQSVTETLNWITAHGTMTLTTDTSLDPTHVYFVRDNDGDYEVGSYRYSIVTEPELEDISTYYVLSIDESLNNYVGTHLAVTSEGLWILPEGVSANSYKILITTGAGTIYTSPGTYIIDADGKPVARFRTSTVIGKDDESRAIIDYKSFKLVDKDDNEQFAVNSLGAYATIAKAIQFTVTRSGYDGIATLSEDVANGTIMTVCLAQTLGIPGIRGDEVAYAQFTKGIIESKTINFPTYGDNQISYDGDITFTYDAKPGESAAAGAGIYSITMPVDVLAPVLSFGNAKVTAGFATGIGQGLICTVQDQTILGRYNEMKVISGEYTSDPEYAFVIGNGTSDRSRSNAIAVDWLGEVQLYLDVDSSASKTTAATSGEDKDLFNAIRALGWYDDVIA